MRVPFPSGVVRKNPDNRDYVAIDQYIRRFLDTLGLDYNFLVTQSTVELLPEDMKTSTGRRQYLATVTGQLEIKTGANAYAVRAGTGADVSFDPDKAVKTAQAEAFKKAAHQFGVALELWDEEHRAELDKSRRVLASEASMKKEVMRIAKARLQKNTPSAAEVAKLFDVPTASLSDRATLATILEKEGIV